MSSLSIIVTQVPKLKRGESIYLTGSINNWVAKDAQYELLRSATDGFYRLELSNCPSHFEFKFTRGSWETEETDASHEIIPNRTWQENDGQLIYITRIQNWKDRQTENSITDVINLQLWRKDYFMPQLNRHRNIWVYLPPNYNNRTKFPVIYLHDAQNVFEGTHSSGYEKWRAGAALNALFEMTGWSCIAVGIEHGDTNRLSEYSPWVHPEHGGGEGKLYIDFLVQTLKPAIDAEFSTLTDAQNTAIMGSSMGGLISMYAALQHGDVFGKVGVFSPSFWWSDDIYELAANQPFNYVQKLVLLAGGQESENMIPDVLAMYNTLSDNNYFEHKIMLDFYEWGKHTESFWALEFDKAVRFLFEEEMQLPNTKADQLVRWNQSDKTLEILIDFENFEFLNSYGKVILKKNKSTGSIVALKKHWKGTHVYKCYLNNGKIITKNIVVS